MHQANREAVFAWLDACNRKPKAELLHKLVSVQPRTSHGSIFGTLIVFLGNKEKLLQIKTILP